MSWRHDRDLVQWHYGIASREEIEGLADAGARGAWMSERLAACAAQLGDFATVAKPGLTREDDVELDLTCEDVEGAPLVVAGGATLRIAAHLEDDGALAVSRIHPIVLTVALHVDLYAPLDAHRKLARRNGARLGGFLRRLEAELEAELFGIETLDYARMAYSRGFHEADRIGKSC